MPAKFQLYQLTGSDIWDDADVNGRCRCRWKWENIAEMALKAAGWEHADWIDLAQHSAQRQVSANRVTTFPFCTRQGMS